MKNDAKSSDCIRLRVSLCILCLLMVCALLIAPVLFQNLQTPYFTAEHPNYLLGSTTHPTDDDLGKTPTEDSEHTSTEDTPLVVAPYPSYLEMCELDYVAPPLKRTRQEALAHIATLAPSYPAMYIVLENQERYPDEMLKSLAGNPEMTDYMYGYLSSDGSVTGGITSEETPDSYPLFLQWDIRWGYYHYGKETLASSGCGPSCLAMAVYYLTGDTSVTPNAVADYSTAHNYYVKDVGTAWALLDTYPTHFGLSVTHPSNNEVSLKTHLDAGNVLICSVRAGDFTAEGHFIVIYGYDENGFKINDPKCVYRSRLSWTYDQIKDDIKRIWSIAK